MAVDRHRVAEALLAAAVFLLPWQTRWIFAQPALAGASGSGTWEYGVLGLYAVEVLILVAVVAFGWKRIAAPLQAVRAPLAVLGGLLLVSAMVGAAPAVSFLFLLHAAVAVVLGLCVAASAQRERLVVAFMIGLLPAAALGWWQTLMGGNPPSTLLGLAARAAETPGDAVVETGARLLRAYGPFPHPNMFGAYLLAGILAAGWLGVRMQRGWRAVGNSALAVVFGATLVITFSRSALLGFAAAALFAAAFALRDPALRRNRAWPAAVGGLLAAALVFHAPLLSRADTSSRLETTSVAERGAQYQEFTATFAHAPLFGTGPGAYTAALAQAFPDRPTYAYQPVHNALLLLLTEIGLAGLAALAWVGKHAVAVLRASGAFMISRRAVWIALAAFIPPALFDHYLWSSWAGLALTAVIIALVYPRRNPVS